MSIILSIEQLDQKISMEAQEETVQKDQPTEQQQKDRKPAAAGAETTAENEIRVAVAGKVSSYLGYAFRILNKSEHRSLTIRATGNAIVKALILIELVKRRIGDLHQLNTIHSMVIEDEFKPKEEGM